MPPGDPSDDDDFSGFVSNEFDVVPGASADQPGDQPGDPGDVSDDSVFSGEYGNEFDNVVREAADDELPTHFGTEFDAPFIAAAATAAIRRSLTRAMRPIQSSRGFLKTDSARSSPSLPPQ